MRAARDGGVRRPVGAMVGLALLAAFLTPYVGGQGAAQAASRHAAGAVSASPSAPRVHAENPVSYPSPSAATGVDEPAISRGTANSLAVWRDTRSGEDGIWATRISSAGAVLDPSGIPISQDGGEDPAVAYDGHNYLVVWWSSTGVFAKRVDRNGVVLDAFPLVLPDGPNRGSHPAVDFDGTNFFVVWGTYLGPPTGTDLFGTRVSPAGTILDSPFMISNATANQVDFGLAFNGTRHLVAWDDTSSDTSDIAGTLVTKAGSALNPLGVPISAAPHAQADPAVIAAGTSFFVTWDDARSGTNTDIYGARVDANGSVLDPSGIAISTAAGDQRVPAVASDGANVLVAWEDASGQQAQVRATRINSSGTALAPGGIAIATLALDAAVAFDGTNYFVAAFDGSIRGARVTTGGAVLDPAGVTISTSSNSQRALDTAFDGQNSLIVWVDDRGGSQIYGGRVGPNGEILDGSGFAVAPGSAVQSNPAVAFDGTNFLVVWEEGGAIRGARVSRAGTVLTRFAITTATAAITQGQPSVAFGGGTFLVVWQSQDISDLDNPIVKIRAARVTTAGVVTDPSGFDVSHDDDLAAAPAVAFGGTKFLVVWQGQSASEFATDIYGTQVTPQGVVSLVGGRLLSGATHDQALPDVAAQGSSYFVVWGDERHGGTPDQSDIYGTRVNDQGLVQDAAGIAISTVTRAQTGPRVAANGSYLVAWDDLLSTLPDVRATEVETDGTVDQPSGFNVASSQPDEHGPAVAAASGAGHFSVAYERFAAEEPYGTTRAFLRSVSPK